MNYTGYHLLVSLILLGACELQGTLGLETPIKEDEKIDLRRELDKITQELLMSKDPLYHSYVFNSGAGNRESFGANVSSTSLFTRWNPVSQEPEVIAVVAVDTPTADILFYRVTNGKLEHMTKWSRFRSISCLTAVNVDEKYQLIVVDTGSPAVIDVFEIIFSADKLEFRLLQSFVAPKKCRSLAVYRVGRQPFLVLPLPNTLAVYRLVSSHYHYHTELSLPRISQILSFTVALQTYLAVNGDTAHILRMTEAGDFVSELMLGHVNEWLAVPVYSYRSDILLLSRTANLTKAFVWAGAKNGFNAVTIPHCESCLEGDWSGAVSVPFQDHNCLLIPQARGLSKLITLGTSLHDSYPVLEKLNVTIENMKQCQGEWRQMKSEMAELEDTLKHVVKRNGKNVITGKWAIGKLKTLQLRVNALVEPHSKVNTSGERTEEEGLLDLETLETEVQATLEQGKQLIKDVEQSERKVWGLDSFRGKVSFQGQLIVDNLTISHLNSHPVDQVLRNTFRKDKPEPIQGNVVMKSLETENIVVNKINNFTSDNLKFSDGLVVLRGDVTFKRPVTVRGDIQLKDGGSVNGMELSKELCQGKEHCSVFPMVNISEEVRGGDVDNTINENPDTSSGGHSWDRVIAGRNLTVLKINGVDWETLTQHVVYKDINQFIFDTVLVKGKVTSEPALWAGTIKENYKLQQRSDKSPLILGAPQSQKIPASANKKILDDLSTASKLIISELEVMGTITCEESEWGAEAVDIVLSDTNPIIIEGDKTFSDSINVTNNLHVEGTVGGLNVSDLLTKDTAQIFYGPTTLNGNITFWNITLTGLWNGMNLSEDIFRHQPDGKVTADAVNVLESLNGIPVSQLVFTGDDGITNVETLSVKSLGVTTDIVVNGKVCNVDLDDFDRRRLSIRKEQNITGNALIKKVKIKSDIQAKKLNDIDISPFLDDSESLQTLYLKELHVEGDITTDEGVNGYNLTELAANAVWLEANNDIEGPLIFKDEVTFDLLECQGFCNEKICDYWFDVDNVVYKSNKTVVFSGKKRFLNLLKISDDLIVENINGNKLDDILTKTTEQEIAGDLVVDGDVTIAEDSIVLGLLNNQNLNAFGHRCSLSENTISCKGNAVFNDSVVVKNFHSSGKINGINFERFMRSVARTNEPQYLEGFKTFIGERVEVENIEDVELINNESWNDFLLDTVSVDAVENVEYPVLFTQSLTVEELSVDYNLDAISVCGVDLDQWKIDAIYINESRYIKRGLHLASASSMGNLTVVEYDGVDIEMDTVKLHTPSTLPSLKIESVTVLEDVEITDTVNGQQLELLERNTLKLSGDQVVWSDLALMGEVIVNGSLNTSAEINNHDLRGVVTLDTDQTLHGKYKFECVEAVQNVSVGGLMSGVNLTSWTQTAVLESSDQQIVGVWQVRGSLELRGPVVGEGKLAGLNLGQLTDNITRDILNVHKEMKSNLTSACEATNARLSTARNQPCELQHLDVTQTLLVPAGPSLVTHFKSGGEDFLVVSENSCTTTIYKWNKNMGSFASLHREMLGFSMKQIVVLYYNQHTYIVTESSASSSDCEYSGKHLWIFIENHFKHISPMDFFSGDLFQGQESTMYLVNATGMFKCNLQDIRDGKASFKVAPHKWDIATDLPKDWTGAEFEWLPQTYTDNNCSEEVISASVDFAREFIAVAFTEAAEVPRYADTVRIYRQNGQLFDKLPAKRVRQVQWLPVPAQTWLVTLQNYSSLHLYQLQGVLQGFQLKVAATVNATGMITVGLPLDSKVNLQPFIILQTSSSVKMLRAFIQGDPYLGQYIICDFDKVLIRIPHN